MVARGGRWGVRAPGCKEGGTWARCGCSLLQALGAPEPLWPGARGREATERALPSGTWSRPASVPATPALGGPCQTPVS